MWLELIFYTLFGGIVLIYAFYKWATVNKDYFSKRRIKQLEPTFLVGNTFGLFANRYDPTEFFDSIYYRFSKEKYVYL